MAWPIPQGGTAILSTWPEALARAARSRHSDEHISIIQDTSLTRVKSSYEQSASSHIGSCAQSPRAHTNKPAAARKQRTRHGGARAVCAAQLRGSKHNTHCSHTLRSIHGARRARAPSTSFARASRAGMNTTGLTRGTHYQIHPTGHGSYTKKAKTPRSFDHNGSPRLAPTYVPVSAKRVQSHAHERRKVCTTENNSRKECFYQINVATIRKCRIVSMVVPCFT